MTIRIPEIESPPVDVGPDLALRHEGQPICAQMSPTAAMRLAEDLVRAAMRRAMDEELEIAMQLQAQSDDYTA